MKTAIMKVDFSDIGSKWDVGVSTSTILIEAKRKDSTVLREALQLIYEWSQIPIENNSYKSYLIEVELPDLNNEQMLNRFYSVPLNHARGQAEFRGVIIVDITKNVDDGVFKLESALKMFDLANKYKGAHIVLVTFTKVSNSILAVFNNALIRNGQQLEYLCENKLPLGFYKNYIKRFLLDNYRISLSSEETQHLLDIYQKEDMFLSMENYLNAVACILEKTKSKDDIFDIGIEKFRNEQDEFDFETRKIGF